MSQTSTRNITRRDRPTLFNRSSKRLQIGRMLRELGVLEQDVQRRYEQAAGVTSVLRRHAGRRWLPRT